MDRIALPDRNTSLDRKNVNGSIPRSASEKDYLNMTLEELMQIPVTSVSFWNNRGNYLDLSIEELMNIPIS